MGLGKMFKKIISKAIMIGVPVVISACILSADRLLRGISFQLAKVDGGNYVLSMVAAHFLHSPANFLEGIILAIMIPIVVVEVCQERSAQIHQKQGKIIFEIFAATLVSLAILILVGIIAGITTAYFMTPDKNRHLIDLNTEGAVIEQLVGIGVFSIILTILGGLQFKAAMAAASKPEPSMALIIIGIILIGIFGGFVVPAILIFI